MSNSNSYSLVIQHLAEDSVTVLQDQLSPFAADSRDFGVNPRRPKGTVEVPIVTAGSATQTNATNFETNADSTVTNVSVTVNQYSQIFHISNTDAQSGLRLKDLITYNLREFANKLNDVKAALITEANFGSAVVTSAPQAFGWTEMGQLFSSLKKSPVKNAVLDSDGFYSGLLAAPTHFQTLQNGGSKVFGWDGIFHSSRWSACGTNIRGYACAPSAIALASGVPVEVRVPGNTIERRMIEVPGIGLTVVAHLWYSLSSRSLFASFDCMFGAGVGDSSALKIVKGT